MVRFCNIIQIITDFREPLALLRFIATIVASLSLLRLDKCK